MFILCIIKAWDFLIMAHGALDTAKIHISEVIFKEGVMC